MIYFNDLRFLSADHYDDCQAKINQSFPDLYAINYLEKGTIGFNEGQNTDLKVLHAPALFWTFPDRFYRYQSLSATPWVHHWVAFNGPKAIKMSETGFLPDFKPSALQLHSKNITDSLMKNLVRLTQSAHPWEQGERVHLLEKLLMMINELHSDPSLGEKDTKEDKLKALARDIRLSPMNHWDFQKCSSHLEWSYSHFRSKFKKVIGMSPWDYLLQSKMLKCAEWIENTDLSIKSVALDSGFDNFSQFSTSFKKVMGMPPMEWRKFKKALN